MKITVLTHFSEAAYNAASYAVSLTQQLAVNKITLYHSQAFVPLSSEFSETYEQHKAFKTRINNNLSSLQKDLKQSALPSIEIDYLTDGQPLLSFVNLKAVQDQPNLFVMGTSAKGILENILGENHIASMIQHCLNPLLIIPNNTKYNKIRNVAFACDLENIHQTVPSKQIKKLAGNLDAKLFVINVGHDDGFENMIVEQETLHTLFDSTSTTYCYENNKDIVRGILKFILDNDIQLLISSPKTYSFLEGIFHQSITKALVQQLTIPLLLLRKHSED